MIEPTIYSTSAASPCKEETIEGSSFLIEQVCSSIANIKFRIAFGQSCLFIFLVLGADVLAEPEVVLLITFLVCVVVSNTGLYLLSGCSFHGVGEHQIFFSLLLNKFFRDVLVDIEPRVCVVLEGGEVRLDPIMQFLWELPLGLVGLCVEVIVFLGLFVEEDLVGADQLVDFFCVHVRTQLLQNIICLK